MVGRGLPETAESWPFAATAPAGAHAGASGSEATTRCPAWEEDALPLSQKARLALWVSSRANICVKGTEGL